MTNLATWFTPSLKTMTRTKGDSAVAASAYRACINLTDERTGEMHPYAGKGGHVSTELIGFTDMKKLWNDAEKSEKRKNSTVARELMVPMPNDWTDEQRIICARGLGEMLRARYGVAVQVSIHRQKDGKNDHAHILFTTRKVDELGNFGEKTRILDEGIKNGEVSNLREAVCEIVNDHAKANGSEWFAYAGKFVDIDPNHIPTVHIPRNCPPERRAELEAENVAILAGRNELNRIAKQHQEVTSQIAAIVEAAKNAPLLPAEEAEEPKPQMSPLSKAYALEDVANEYQQAKRRRAKTLETKKEWVKALETIEAEKPDLWDTVQILGSKLMKRWTPRFIVDQAERRDRAMAQIAKCDKVAARLETVLDDPVKQSQYVEFHTNMDHQNAIREAKDQSPDARRKTTPDAPAQAKPYKPSSIELETALTPP